MDATAATDIILKLSNIESYYGPIMAIRGISLEVPRGSIVTLLGANGAGKTTVLKTISGHPRSAERLDRVFGQADSAHGGRQDRSSRPQPRAGRA